MLPVPHLPPTFCWRRFSGMTRIKSLGRGMQPATSRCRSATAASRRVSALFLSLRPRERATAQPTNEVGLGFGALIDEAHLARRTRAVRTPQSSSIRKPNCEPACHLVRACDPFRAYALLLDLGLVVGSASLFEHPPVCPTRSHSPERFQIATELHERSLLSALPETLNAERCQSLDRRHLLVHLNHDSLCRIQRGANQVFSKPAVDVRIPLAPPRVEPKWPGRQSNFGKVWVLIRSCGTTRQEPLRRGTEKCAIVRPVSSEAAYEVPARELYPVRPTRQAVEMERGVTVFPEPRVGRERHTPRRRVRPVERPAADCAR
jgi:hypothetical protein